MNEFFSVGAVLFYLLIASVLISVGLLIRSLRRERKQEIVPSSSGVKQVEQDPEERRLLALAEADRSRIDLAIRLIDCRVRWNPDPTGDFDHVYFEFKIFNGSSYPVQFDKIGGFIEYGGYRVKGKIDFYTGKWPLSSLEPRFHTSIEVVQWLSIVDMNRLRQDWEKQVFPYFSFKPLRVTISDGEGLGRVIPKPLAFSGITAITLNGKLN
jgi:hypothetical protein